MNDRDVISRIGNQQGSPHQIARAPIGTSGGRQLRLAAINRLLLLAIVLGGAVNTTACSGLAKSAWLEPIENDSTWAYHKDERGTRFTHQDAVIIVYNSDLGGDTVLVGPPLLPIIPFFSDARVFVGVTMSVGVQAGQQDVEIDLSKVRLTVPNREGALYPWNIDRFPHHIDASELEPAQRLVGERRDYKLNYKINRHDYVNKWSAKFTLHFDSVKIAGERVTIPPLTFTKATKYHYVPIYIRH